MSPRLPATDAQGGPSLEVSVARVFHQVCAASGVKIEALADAFGVSRAKLYLAFEGITRHPRISWLHRLPVEAQLDYMRRWAAQHGHEVRRAEADPGASLIDLVRATSAALTSVASSEADGYVSAAEAQSDLAELRELETKVAMMIAHREKAVRERGAKVTPRIVGGRA